MKTNLTATPWLTHQKRLILRFLSHTKILAGVVFVLTVSSINFAAADSNANSIHMSDWQKYYHALPSPFMAEEGFNAASNVAVNKVNNFGDNANNIASFNATDDDNNDSLETLLNQMSAENLIFGLAFISAVGYGISELNSDSGSGGGGGSASQRMCDNHIGNDTTDFDPRRVFVQATGTIGTDPIAIVLSDSFTPDNFPEAAIPSIRFQKFGANTSPIHTVTGMSSEEGVATFISSEGILLEPGDKIFLDNGEEYRLYRKTATDFRLAREVIKTSNGVCTSYVLANGEFYITEENPTDEGASFITVFIGLGHNDADDLITIFEFRDAIRGFMNTENAVVLDNFYFIGYDSQLRNYHLEYRTDLLNTESLALHADSGFKRQDNGKTSLYYSKMTATKSLTQKTDLYMQLSTGKVSSDFYTNSRLQGLAMGMFADGILRHDDSYHVRLSQPFSSDKNAAFNLSMGARFGTPNNHMRFGINKKLSDDKSTTAKIFLTHAF